ncbi:hypothetical protein TNCT_90361 [Trichonephila clavata]|uniref:Uncharacterized protein n=1 Tax=Trichonephila clavata TaxID=2740835 RepID=A0A8X6EXU4_TRICU|nr:hypothetical protein TNCT_90361 [Trichonephila clavata]
MTWMSSTAAAIILAYTDENVRSAKYRIVTAYGNKKFQEFESCACTLRRISGAIRYFYLGSFYLETKTALILLQQASGLSQHCSLPVEK